MFSFLYHCQDFYMTWLYIWVTRRVAYTKQELLTLREHLSSPPFLMGSGFLFYFLFSVCCLIMCLYILCSVLWCPLRFLHKNDVNSSLPPVVCRRAHILFTLFVFACAQWCPTHIVLCFCLFVFVLCTLFAPSIFSNVNLY